MTNKEFMTFTKRPRQIDDTDGIIFYEDEADEADSKYDTYVGFYFVIPLTIIYFYLAY